MCAGYELEKKDSPGVAVDLSSSLHSQGTLDFMLVKNVGELILLRTACPHTNMITNSLLKPASL